MSTLKTPAAEVPAGIAPSPYSGRDDVREFFAAHAAELDRHDSDVRPGLRMLGKRGLLDLGTPHQSGNGLALMLLLIEDVSAECLSSGFALWAQRMVLEYLGAHADRPPVTAKLPALRSGIGIGVTAMAPALRHVAGLDPVPIVANRSKDGLRLNGPIRWASNLFDGALVVAPARFEEGGGTVVFFHIGDPGVALDPPPELLALGATSSSSLSLTDVKIPESAVLSSDLEGFVRSFRPTFLLAQSAFCSGLALAARTEATQRLTGVNQEFTRDVHELSRQHDSVRQRLFDFARDPARPPAQELLRLRLDAARSAGEATKLETAMRGGAGYLAASATSRRLREAAFLPIQAPSEGQLRWELSRHD